MKIVYWVSVLVVTSLTAPSIASELSLREWSKDSEHFEEQILTPLRERFANQPCQEKFGPYIDAIVNELQQAKTQFKPESFLLLHEISQVTAMDLRRFDDAGDCPNTLPWPHIEHHINSLITYTNHVISIFD